MSEPYLGEIRMFAGNYEPTGWALCNGQQLSITTYEALYSLLGTTYGGDGITNFALPDLQGRIPIHPNTNHLPGVKGGSETVTVHFSEMPSHTHVLYATSEEGTKESPSNMLWAKTGADHYASANAQVTVSMSPQTVSSVGGNEPHDNMMPSLVVSFIIALNGIFPQQE